MTRPDKIRKLLGAVALSALLAALAGCGSSSGDDAPTKTEFIAKADVICRETDKRQTTKFNAYVKENGEDGSKAGQEELVKEVGLPEIATELEELRALGVPEGDEDEVNAIFDGAEEALEKAEEDPGTVLQTTTDPFSDVEKLAKDYGFKECGIV
jgi:hypothetical protein